MKESSKTSALMGYGINIIRQAFFSVFFEIRFLVESSPSYFFYICVPSLAVINSDCCF